MSEATPGLPWQGTMKGRLDRHVIPAPSLVGNPLGDPAERPLWVYVPPGYDDDTAHRYPAVYVIQGYAGYVATWANRSAFRQPYLETADALFATGDVPPCVVVYVDAWTAYGGSQFVDSKGTGNYHTYLCEDVVGWVDAHYRTLPQPAHRAIQGKSSGGFGAMISPMLRPDTFGGFATHAGDSLYEFCYIPDFGKAVRALREYDGSIQAWWDDFRSRVSFTKSHDHTLLMLLGVSACFSPDDNGVPVLPFDASSGRLLPEVWERWLAWDPVRMAPDHADALRSQRAIWIDAGRSDEWHLDLGAQAFYDTLVELGVTGVAEVHFELFDGTHGQIDYRYPLALEFLARRISPAA